MSFPINKHKGLSSFSTPSPVLLLLPHIACVGTATAQSSTTALHRRRLQLGPQHQPGRSRLLRCSFAVHPLLLVTPFFSYGLALDLFSSMEFTGVRPCSSRLRARDGISIQLKSECIAASICLCFLSRTYRFWSGISKSPTSVLPLPVRVYGFSPFSRGP